MVKVILPKPIDFDKILDDLKKPFNDLTNSQRLDFIKLTNCLETIDNNKPLEFMVHGRWQSYSHYEMTFDSTTIWFMDNLTGGRVPVKMKQIERWRAKDASDELKAAIAELKEMK